MAASTRVTKGGATLTQRSWDLIADARRAAGLKPDAARVVQGGFNKGGVAASAGTHDGAGVFDLSVAGLTEAQQIRLVTELRKRNACAWIRSKKYGWNGGAHIHGVVRDQPGISSSARSQVTAYDRGLNGLANKRKDPFPRPKQQSVETMRKKEVPKVAASKPGPTLRHPGTQGKTVMHKTPVTAPVTVVGDRWYTAAIIDIPKGGEYACTLQVRMPGGVGEGECELVRLGWSGLAKEDSTGHNQVDAANKLAGVWRRWRTPIQGHTIAGGGKLAYRILMPPGAHKMRFVAKSTRVA